MTKGKNRMYRTLSRQLPALPFKGRCSSVLLCTLLAAGSLGAAPNSRQLPTGGQVIQGNAVMQQQGGHLQVDQSSSRAILNWQSFDIGRDASVHFQQPGVNAVALNRVLAGEASRIHGQLSANGQLFLVNPQGVLFGPGSRVNTGGLVASTLALDDADFMAGSYHFSLQDTPGALLNQGNLTSAEGGYIALLSKEVRNEGVISSRLGHVALAAGEAVTLDISGNSLLSVQVEPTTLETLVENRQLVQAEGGRVFVGASSVNRLVEQAVALDEEPAGMLVQDSDGSFRLIGNKVHNTGTISAASPTSGGEIRIDAGHLVDSGTLEASGEQGRGGELVVSADRMLLSGDLLADGAQGGRIRIDAGNLVQGGRISAGGTTGTGGTIHLALDNLIQVTSATLDVSSQASTGGSIRVEAAEHLFSSATYAANGRAGGDIALTAGDVSLYGASLTAEGATGGGRIRVGGDFQGSAEDLASADRVILNESTTLAVSATEAGDGGEVIVWSDEQTHFAGTIETVGGQQGGDGGFVEVSGKQQLAFSGEVDTSAPAGASGTLLLDPKDAEITTSAPVGGAFGVVDLAAPNPAGGSRHGSGGVYELPNGNIVVLSPEDSFQAFQAGAAFLYQPDGSLVSWYEGAIANSLYGSHAYGNTNFAILPSGDYVIASPQWNGDRGAVTWMSQVTGMGVGQVGNGSSLVGTAAGDRVGLQLGILSSGNYLVFSPDWNGSFGAVTWGDGAAGVVGDVSIANSLIGVQTNDFLGSGGFSELGGGRYMVRSPDFDGMHGAVTLLSDGTALSTQVSSANSLLGGSPNDQVGSLEPVDLGTGNFLLSVPHWNSDRGLVYLFDPLSPLIGVLDTPTAQASGLTGVASGDRVGVGEDGAFGISPLPNGNFIVHSPDWNDGRGAVTFGFGFGGVGFGSPGIFGDLTTSNSLTGVRGSLDPEGADQVGVGWPVPLGGGKHLIASPNWNEVRGAVFWFDEAVGFSNVIHDGTNSLLGSNPNDSVGTQIFPGIGPGGDNYLVASPDWSNSAGAVTFGNRAAPVFGPVDGTNSLVGSLGSDGVGYEVLMLPNGDYVVASPWWNGSRGAVTYADGSTGIVGAVSSGNSLTGANSGDAIGSGGMDSLFGPLGEIAYLIRSPLWNAERGAATWADTSNSLVGQTVGVANSLVGVRDQIDPDGPDQVGSHPVDWVGNGLYVLRNPQWYGGRGSVTELPGDQPTIGTIDGTNSLIGSNTGDQVGNSIQPWIDGDPILPFGNDNYLVLSPEWNSARGAATFMTGGSPTVGPIDQLNSLIGTNPGDRVGSGALQVGTYGDNYIVRSIMADGAGAFTFGNTSFGVTDFVNVSNSLMGNPGDNVGGDGSDPIENNLYDLDGTFFLLTSPGWSGSTGAITLLDTDTGVPIGYVDSSNSRVGLVPGDFLGDSPPLQLATGDDYILAVPGFDGSNSAGAFTTFNITESLTGLLGASNTFSGNPNDLLGQTWPTILSGGGFVAPAPDADLAGTDTGHVRLITLNPAGAFSGFLGFSDDPAATVQLHPDQLTDLLDAGTNVEIQASNDVLIQNPVVVTPSPTAGDLTLRAGRGVSFNAYVDTGGGSLFVHTDDPGANLLYRDPGQAQIYLGMSTFIDLGGTGAAILDTGPSGRFVNDSGSSTPIMNADYWKVYSQDPAVDLLNGMTADFKRYNCTFDAGCLTPGTVIPAVGNGLLYSVAPVLDVLPNDETITYGDPVPAFTTFFTGGFIDGDTPATSEITGTAVVDILSPVFSTSGNIQAGLYDLVSPSGLSSGLGYQIAPDPINFGVFTVNPLPTNVSSLIYQDKIYDQGNAAFLSGTVDTLIPGDLVSLDSDAIFNTNQAGTAIPVNWTSIWLTGPDAVNYSYTSPTSGAGVADILPRPLNVINFVANDKVYDTLVTATATGDLDDVLPPDDVSLSLVANFADKNAGVGKLVSIDPSTLLTGTDSGNYLLNLGSTTTASITPAPLTITGVSAQSREYDGTTTTTATGTLNGVLGADTVGATFSGIFNDPDVGTAKPVAVGGTLTGMDAGNYTLVSASTQADILAKALLLTNVTAEDKVYDGLPDAVVSGELSGAISGDDVQVDAQGAFNDPDVGDGKPVNIAGFTLSGADAGNYTLQSPGSTAATASITPRPLTVTGVAADDKVYDGTLAASMTGTVSGFVAGDNVSAQISGNFADPDVGTDKPVIGSVLLSGSDAGNYSADGVAATANITPLLLLVENLLAADKTYDGTTAAQVSGSLDGVIPGDQVDLALSGSFEDRNTGTDKLVNAAGTLSGDSAGNYALSALPELFADIQPLLLSLTNIQAESRDADGTVGAVVGAELQGVVPGDTVGVVLQGEFDSPEPGDDKVVTLVSVELTGPDAGNYRVTAGQTTLASLFSGDGERVPVWMDGYVVRVIFNPNSPAFRLLQALRDAASRVVKLSLDNNGGDTGSGGDPAAGDADGDDEQVIACVVAGGRAICFSGDDGSGKGAPSPRAGGLYFQGAGIGP